MQASVNGIQIILLEKNVWGKCLNDILKDVSVEINIHFKGKQSVLYCDRLK